MKVIEVTYRKKYNLGNFQTHDIEVVANVEPEEDPEEVLLKLKQITDNVHAHITS